MDFEELKNRYDQDHDYPDRAFDLEMYRRVLEGTIYDCLKYPFYQTTKSYGKNGEYIPLSQRRPCVRYRLAKVVVDDSVTLLFGEGRFPSVHCEDLGTKDNLTKIINDRHLNLVMIDAATKGSTGSSAILVKVIEGRLFFKASYTAYLTPTFNPKNPDEIIAVTEKYKIYGKELKALGYTEKLVDEETYWFMRKWDLQSEIYYIPWKVAENEKHIPQIDEARTIVHNLDLMLIVWAKNLPGSDSDIDGLCTFQDAITTNIELDYQMSQCGRGLKYSSEPLLMIRNPGLNTQGQAILGEGNIIEVDEGGDAKHIEISGDGCRAVLEYAKALREVILENIHGNRSTPEKTHTVQSGKAMEMLNQALIWLTDKLRITYGEGMYLNLLKLIIKISQKTDIFIENERIKQGSFKANELITLKWSDWFAATRDDRLKDAQTMSTLTKGARLMSTQTAVASLADEYDIADTQAELKEINKESEQDVKNQQSLNQSNAKNTPKES